MFQKIIENQKAIVSSFFLVDKKRIFRVLTVVYPLNKYLVYYFELLMYVKYVCVQVISVMRLDLKLKLKAPASMTLAP